MNDDLPNASRREVLKSALAASLATPAVAAGMNSAGAKEMERAAPANVIVAENALPGERDWQLTRVRLDKTGGFRSPLIEGYCSRQSVSAGETIEFKVSTNPPVDFQLEIFRLGYYGGAGARKLTTIGPLRGTTQPDPEIGPQRLRECRWTTSTSLTIPDDWRSGVYLGRLSTLTDDDGTGYTQSYVVFVVRDKRPCDVLFQVSDNTWQAYNRWPDDYSLYTDPRGAHAANVAVSFDRPYGKYAQIFESPQSVGSGEFLLWEFPLCYWLEQHGYDVSYCANVDLLDPAEPRRAKAFLSVGHDEYWDVRQYDALKGAVDAGVNLLFLSANTAYMVSPFEPNAAGQANRTIWRKTPFGALSEREIEVYGHTMGPFPEPGPDEGLLIGARSIVPANGGADWICTKPEHWIFEGTGMRRGERVPGLVGWEFHGDPAEIAGLEVVGEGNVRNAKGLQARWTSTIYPGPKGNFVFNASTIWWSQGLSSPPGHMLPWSHGSRPHGPDARIERITHNLLRRALGMQTVSPASDGG